MIGKILPVILALIGLGGGVGAGMVLRPDPSEVATTNPCGEVGENGDEQIMAKPKPKEEDASESSNDFVKLNNQFVVPIVDNGRVGSLVVVSLNLEIVAGQSETIYQVEPKLRDVFLQVLFDHANIGGFSGSFTASPRMSGLRTALLESAQSLLGNTVIDVLIVDMVRQDA